MNEDKSSRYHRLRRRASAAAVALAVVLLVVALVSGLSAGLRTVAIDAAGGSLPVGAVLYCLVLALAAEVVQFPFACHHVALDRRYGLLTQTIPSWLLDHARGAVLTLALGVAAGLIVVAALQISPDGWWIITWLVFSALMVGLAAAAPVVLLPLFYCFTPLDRPELAVRLATLAERAGTPVVGVFEWRLSDRTRRANAVLAGLGRTRRILVSDTLLAEHSDDEIAVVLAHEMAHHRHRDMWSSLALESALLLAALYAADAVLGMSVGSFGIAGPGDLAALPLIVLAGGAASSAGRPLLNAWSRMHERRADRFALELTRDAPAFVTAMRRLAAQNLAEERPPRIVELLFHTHPPTAARVEAALSWAGRAPRASRSA